MSKRASSAFVSPRELLGWAKEAIDEIDAVCRAFFEGNPGTHVIEPYSEPGYELYKFRLTRPLPLAVARKATEALNNIRLSFDQAYLSGLRACGVSVAAKTLHFPWAQDPADLERRLGEVPESLRPIFRGVQPYPRGNAYPGGNDDIRAMAQISGRNKHIARVAFSARVVGIRLPDFTIGCEAPAAGKFDFFRPRWDSVNNEMVIARFPAGSTNAKDNYTIAFDVVFDETSPVFKKDVIDSLELFLGAAHSFVDSFEQACP
jgi:hypothetical protein